MGPVARENRQRVGTSGSEVFGSRSRRDGNLSHGGQPWLAASPFVCAGCAEGSTARIGPRVFSASSRPRAKPICRDWSWFRSTASHALKWNGRSRAASCRISRGSSNAGISHWKAFTRACRPPRRRSRARFSMASGRRCRVSSFSGGARAGFFGWTKRTPPRKSKGTWNNAVPNPCYRAATRIQIFTEAELITRAIARRISRRIDS